MQSQQDDSQRGPAEQPRRAAIYVRVSTAKQAIKVSTSDFEQDPAVQEMPLKALVAQRGWKLTNVYSDRASGAKERRPGLHAWLQDGRRGAFDVVVVWRFDRFARSVKQLVDALEEFGPLELTSSPTRKL